MKKPFFTKKDEANLPKDIAALNAYVMSAPDAHSPQFLHKSRQLFDKLAIQDALPKSK